MKTDSILLAVIAVLLAVLIFVIVSNRRRLSLFAEELDCTLDDMLAGKNPDFEFTSDTLSGKADFKLKRLYEILSQKNEQSKKDKEKLNALISDISHQKKKPIANLKMYMQILSERAPDEKKWEEFLKLSLAQTEKLEFLMISLAKMSRLENGMISFSPEKIPAVEVIADGLAQMMHIAVDVDCGENIVIFCDKKWTCEAVFNILDNTVKYTFPNGNIRVSIDKNEFYASIKIKNDGIIIPESEQAEIFGRFYRSPMVAGTEGFDIGLFLSRQILSGQQGFVTVRSEPEYGTEFTACLPLE